MKTSLHVSPMRSRLLRLGTFMGSKSQRKTRLLIDTVCPRTQPRTCYIPKAARSAALDMFT
ncbi:hypothetical protein BDR07DRAFT_1442107 [Suillus spraguei]|nr:hypothetical protein BDR07DRAFT_1442107 [Suillus spraguei]